MKSNYIMNDTIKKNPDLATYFLKKVEDEQHIKKLKKRKYKEFRFYSGLSFFTLPILVSTVFITGLIYNQSWVFPLLGSFPLCGLLIFQGKEHYKKNYSFNNAENILFKTKLDHDDFLEISKYISEKDMLEIVKLQEEENYISNSQDFVNSIETSLKCKINVTEKDKNLKNYVSSLYEK